MTKTVELTDAEYEVVLNALDWYAEDRIECADDPNRDRNTDAAAAAQAVSLYERLTGQQW
jgi:hypothetical protein